MNIKELIKLLHIGKLYLVNEAIGIDDSLLDADYCKVIIHFDGKAENYEGLSWTDPLLDREIKEWGLSVDLDGVECTTIDIYL